MSDVKIIDLDNESEKKQLLGNRTVKTSTQDGGSEQGVVREAQEAQQNGESMSEKEKGCQCFSEGKYQEAVEHWQKGLRTVNYILSKKSEIEEGKNEEFEKMKRALHLNLAIGYLRVGSGMECIHHSDKVLELDPQNVKALYRKAQGLYRLSEYQDALKCLQQLLKIEPDEVSAIKLYREIKLEAKQHAAKEKRMNRALFEQLEHDERSIVVTPSFLQRMRQKLKEIRQSWTDAAGTLTALLYICCFSCKRRAQTFFVQRTPKRE